MAACFALLFFAAVTDSGAVQSEHVNVDLISESSALVPGQTAWLGLHMRHDPHWHSYWINPGDSGLPTRLKWSLPDGYTADAIIWPAPSRFEISGLYNFGYSGEVVLPVAIHVPANAAPGQTVALSVEANWLVCREECITGKAALELEMPITTREKAVGSPTARLFAASRNATPEAASWSGKAVLDGDQVRIQLIGKGLPDVADLDVFAVERRILASAPAEVRRESESLVILARRNDYFDKTPTSLDLVLTSRMTNGRFAAWQVGIPFVNDDTPH